MKRVTTMVVAFLIFLLPAVRDQAFGQVARDPNTAENAVRRFMRAKLEHAKDSLEGLTVENFEMIAKSADHMTKLSESALWRVYQTPEYVRLSTEFRIASAALKKSSVRKDIDAATLAYMKLTLRCVECHKYVRTIRIAKGESGKSGVWVALRKNQPSTRAQLIE